MPLVGMNNTSKKILHGYLAVKYLQNKEKINQ